MTKNILNPKNEPPGGLGGPGRGIGSLRGGFLNTSYQL